MHTNGLRGIVRYDVTADVAALLAGGAEFGWLLRKSAEGQGGLVEYRSREDGTGPHPALVVVFESAPGEPDLTAPILGVQQPPERVEGDPAPAIVVSYLDDASGVDLDTRRHARRRAARRLHGGLDLGDVPAVAARRGLPPGDRCGMGPRR